MVTLRVLNKKQNKYLLVDEKHNVVHDLFFEFHGIEMPNVGDTIELDERLLDKTFEGFAQPYAFEPVKHKSEYDERNKIDYAILNILGKDVLLRRIYGW